MEDQKPQTKLDKVLNFLRPKLPSFLSKAFTEADGKTVSSARVWGGLTFMVLHFCNVLLVGTICWAMRKAMISEPHDVPALMALVSSIKNLAWLYLVLSATALALYGVNVWKYVAQIKNGTMGSDKDKDDVDSSLEATVTKVAQTAAPAPEDKPATDGQKPSKDDL